MTERSVYRKVLEDVFDLSDLDGNGTMSREEFNWYNIRTSDEEVGDDEWEVVEGTWDISFFFCLFLKKMIVFIVVMFNYNII